MEHILPLYDNAPSHELYDYCARVGDEEISRCEESGHYITSIAQDKMWNLKKNSCKKDFPSHATLTPGLYLMTCGCSYKSIYGFSLMLTGESPKMLFDVIMTRFEEDFNPQIIYDASCKVQSICSQNIFYDFVRFYRLRNTATTGSWRCSCLNLHYFCGIILGDATIRQLFQVWFCDRYRLSAFLKEIKTYGITQEP